MKPVILTILGVRILGFAAIVFGLGLGILEAIREKVFQHVMPDGLHLHDTYYVVSYHSAMLP